MEADERSRFSGTSTLVIAGVGGGRVLGISSVLMTLSPRRLPIVSIPFSDIDIALLE